MVRPLLHREAEQNAVDEALAGLRAGTPAVLTFLGGRGTGKSSLLSHALSRAAGALDGGLDGVAGGVAVLRAHCHDSEREFAFGVVRQLFDQPAVFGTHGGDGGHGGHGGEAPGLGGLLPGLGEPSHDLLHSMFAATRSLAAARPVIIAIDDVTKADRQSLRWCGYIARRLDGLPVAMILTGDPDDPGAEELLGDLDTLPYASVLRPGPLCADCVSRAVGAVWDGSLPVQVAAACHALTGGNPLVLRALTTRLAAADAPSEEFGALGAAALAETTLAWLAAREPGVSELLEHYAIVGTDLDTAALLANRGELVAAESRRSLRRLGILADDAPDRFADPAFRAAALSRMAPERRQELHLRAAGLLQRLGERADRAAEHLMSVGPTGCAWAVEALTRAALDAAGAGEWERASRYLRRALAEPADQPPPGLVAALAAAELHRDLPACVRHLRTLLDQPGTPRERARLVRPLAHALVSADTAAAGPLFADAGRALAEFAASGTAVAGAGRGLDADDRGPLLALAAQALLGGCRGGARTAVRLVDKGGSDLASREFVAAWALAVAARGRSRERALRLVERCVGGGHAEAPGWEVAGWADVGVAVALAWCERLDGALGWAEQAAQRAAGRGSATEHAFALTALADVRYRRGDLPGAYEAAQRAAGLAGSCGAAGLQLGATATAAKVLVQRAELGAAAALLDGADPKAAPHPVLRAAALEARGLLALAAGEPRDALRLFLDCGYQLAARGIANPSAIPWRAYAIHAQAALGEPAPAWALAREELAYASRWGGPAARGRALVAAAAACPEQRVPMLREAADLLAGSGAALDLAAAQVGLGTALNAAGAEVAARDALGRGLELATGCGATALAATARERLVAAGARRRGEPRLDRAPLTPSEQRVIDLVLRGMTSGEVAQALLISKRTVDTHLARVYRKLGIRSRTRLAAALADTGTDG